MSSEDAHTRVCAYVCVCVYVCVCLCVEYECVFAGA